MEFILASSSPHRLALLNYIGIRPKVIPSNIEEIIPPHGAVRAVTVELARQKLEAVCARSIVPEDGAVCVIAADTVATVGRFGRRILGKPISRADAKRMIGMLSGRRHCVTTGICAARFDEKGNRAAEIRAACTTGVRFVKMSTAEIENYLDSGEWEEVSGAFRLQGRSACFIDAIYGSYSNVIGLPIHLLYSMLKKIDVCINEKI